MTFITFNAKAFAAGIRFVKYAIPRKHPITALTNYHLRTLPDRENMARLEASDGRMLAMYDLVATTAGNPPVSEVQLPPKFAAMLAAGGGDITLRVSEGEGYNAPQTVEHIESGMRCFTDLGKPYPMTEMVCPANHDNWLEVSPKVMADRVKEALNNRQPMDKELPLDPNWVIIALDSGGYTVHPLVGDASCTVRANLSGPARLIVLNGRLLIKTLSGMGRSVTIGFDDPRRRGLYGGTSLSAEWPVSFFPTSSIGSSRLSPHRDTCPLRYRLLMPIKAHHGFPIAHILRSRGLLA